MLTSRIYSEIFFCLWQLLFQTKWNPFLPLSKIEEFLFTLQDSGLNDNSWSSPGVNSYFFVPKRRFLCIYFLSILLHLVIQLFSCLPLSKGQKCSPCTGQCAHKRLQLRIDVQWLVKTFATLELLLILFHRL